MKSVDICVQVLEIKVKRPFAYCGMTYLKEERQKTKLGWLLYAYRSLRAGHDDCDDGSVPQQ